MRSVRLLSAAMLVITGLVIAGTTTSASAAGSKDLSFLYGAKFIKNEVTYAEGRLSTPDERPVWLQYKSGKTWKTKTKTSTWSGSDGYFEVHISTTKSRYWRFVAPAHNGLKKIVGNARKVTIVKQKVQSIIIHNAKQCRAFPSEITVIVDFYPSRVGRPVTFAFNGNSIQGNEDLDGKAKLEFTPPNDGAGGTFSLKATADAIYGMAAISSKTVKYVRSDDNCIY